MPKCLLLQSTAINLQTTAINCKQLAIKFAINWTDKPLRYRMIRIWYVMNDHKIRISWHWRKFKFSNKPPECQGVINVFTLFSLWGFNLELFLFLFISFGQNHLKNCIFVLKTYFILAPKTRNFKKKLILIRLVYLL